MRGNLKQCMNCGHGGWNSHELKNGLCSECYENEMYDFENEYEHDEWESMGRKPAE